MACPKRVARIRNKSERERERRLGLSFFHGLFHLSSILMAERVVSC
jgi:hypothetical protein